MIAEPHHEMRRANGDMLCEKCGLPYWKHPMASEIGFDGKPFLHELCNGDWVKL